QKMVLQAAYDSLKQEFNRISYLLLPSGDNPLGEFARPISSKFGKSEADVRGLLKEMDEAIKSGNLPKGWSHYTELKSKLSLISSELLAVIGGAYLVKAEIDDVGDFDQGKRLATMSFSRKAQALVKDLADRSGMGWGSVLIVGEERLGHTEA